MTDFPWGVSVMVLALLGLITYIIVVILKLDDQSQPH